MSRMNPVSLLIEYTLWHYQFSLLSYILIWRNFLWFVGHLFSFSTLIRTLFSPWKRMTDEKHRGFHPSLFFESILVNIIMRIVGAVARIFLIGIGLIFFLITLLLGAAFFLVWIVLPILIPLIIAAGIYILIS